jgi:hypothetical protein
VALTHEDGEHLGVNPSFMETRKIDLASNTLRCSARQLKFLTQTAVAFGHIDQNVPAG